MDDHRVGGDDAKQVQKGTKGDVKHCRRRGSNMT